MSFDHPNLEIIKFTANYDDGTTYEVQVKGVKSIELSIPEDTTYQFTIHFKVTGETLTKLRYTQEVKAYGIVVRKRELYLGDEFAPREEPYSVTVAKDKTPSGRMLRGNYACTSTYFSGDEHLFQTPWKLTVTKKI